jgi:hypothetical protein
LQYDGVWMVDRGYCPGAFVSDRGSGWVCVKTVEPGIRPGSSHECWRLVIKRGRDGRDAVPALA